MKKCDECDKETEEFNFLKFNLPENPDESNIDPKKAHFKSVEIWVCEECKVKFDNKFKEIAEFIRDSQKQLHRKWYEDKGDIEDLK